MDATLRIGAFLAIFAVVAVAEWRFPKRLLNRSRAERWRVNIGLLVFDVIAQRLTVGAAALASAIYAADQGWGLFNLLGWPAWLEGILGFLALDLAIYLQHVASHAVPWFWRLHKVHHADLDVDLTTGIRFHPVEIILSAIYKAVIIALLGVDPWLVLLFEAVLNVSAVYTHGNVRIPERIDRMARWAFCTPDMHRVHHSVIPAETNSNYGFFLSVWDRVFKTLRQAPAKGHDGIEIGLPQHRDPLGFLQLLTLPFGAAQRGGGARRTRGKA